MASFPPPSLKSLLWLFSRMTARRDERVYACLAPGFERNAFPFPKSGFPSYATLLCTAVILWHMYAQLVLSDSLQTHGL